MVGSLLLSVLRNGIDIRVSRREEEEGILNRLLFSSIVLHFLHSHRISLIFYIRELFYCTSESHAPPDARQQH